MEKDIERRQESGIDKIISNGEPSIPDQKAKQKPSLFKKRLRSVCIFFLVLLVWVAILQYLSAEKYEAVVNVIGENGEMKTNPLTDKLDYGDLPKGNSSMRMITIKNKGRSNIYVKIIKTGEIADLLEINKNNFILHPGEEDKIELSIRVPANAGQKKYDGAIIIFKFPKIF
jgi:hypothetical protein